jgi:DNA-binding NtrC family response regulator
LVEDDPLIREVAADMLAGAGHRVLRAADAEGALRLLDDGPVDVMVTDRGLPGLSGDALAHRAIEIQPDLRVVFATGVAAAVPDAALPGAVFLIKPYGAEDLERALARPRPDSDRARLTTQTT